MRRPSDSPAGSLAVVEVLEFRRLLHAGFSAAINFQPSNAPVPSGYLVDAGHSFRTHSNGLSYGWNVDNREYARDRNHSASPDQRYDTLNHMQLGSSRSWEIAVPNGEYQVRVVAGDAGFWSSVYKINVEGVLTVDGTASSSKRWFEGTSVVTVSDGRLTISNASGAKDNKINFVEINEIHHHEERPQVSIAAVRNTTEGSSTSGRFTVTRSGDTASPLSVTYSIGGSATNGVDYQTLSGVVTIAAGSTSANIDVIALNDAHVEGNETVSLTLTPNAGYDITAASAVITIFDATEPPPSQPANWSVRVNFQPGNAPVPDFYRVDAGAVYGTRGNGMTYGWNHDTSGYARDRNDAGTIDQRYDTLTHMHRAGDSVWEFAVPNGTYTVRVVAGDPSHFDSIYRINVEGVLAVNATPTSTNRFAEGTVTVNVLDGRITISNASGSVNNKIAFVEIMAGSHPIPVVSLTSPVKTASENGDVGIFRFTRTGSTASSLTVNYIISGGATNGVDYQSISGSITIPAGASFADLPIIPIDDNLVEGNEKVALQLATSSTYSLGEAQGTSITIIDNDTGSPSQNLSWSNAATSYARAEAFGATVNGKLYVFGGYGDGQWKPVARVDVYDPTTNQWTRLRDLPERLTHSATAVDGQYIYIAGGYPGTATGQAFSTNKVWRYDTITDTYTAMKNLPFARGGSAMAVLNGHLYSISGSDSNRVDRPDVWSLDLNNPSANWVTRASLPQARNHFGAVTLGGFIYAVGGQTGQDANASFKSNVWRYNPSNNTWTSVANLLSPPRSHAAAATFVHNGRIIIAGGETNGSEPGKLALLRNVEAYDPASNSWSVLTSIPLARTSGVAGSFGDKLIFNGGYNSGFKGETWIGTFT